MVVVVDDVFVAVFVFVVVAVLVVLVADVVIVGMSSGSREVKYRFIKSPSLRNLFSCIDRVINIIY